MSAHHHNPAAEQLSKDLSDKRELVEVRDGDELSTMRHRNFHQTSIADIKEAKRAADIARRERQRDRRDAQDLGDLYRRATRAGTRARIRAEITNSAEMRALRVASVRRTSILAGLPVLASFAAWSTSGAQAGVTKMLKIQPGTFASLASWFVEPALITVVALIIIGRAILNSSGGKVDWRATSIEWTCLGSSLALNIIGGWPAGSTIRDGALTAIPHSIGPLGCAATAFLVGLFDAYVTAARPWDGAPRIADLDLGPNSGLFAVRESTSALGVDGEQQAFGERTLMEIPSANGANANGANGEQANANTANANGANGEQANANTANANGANGEQANANTANANGAITGELILPRSSRMSIDRSEIIRTLDSEVPDWRSTVPSARALARMFGYSSASSGQKIRTQIMIIIEEQEQ